MTTLKQKRKSDLQLAFLGSQWLNSLNFIGLLFLRDKKLELQICHFSKHPYIILKKICSLDCLGIKERRDDSNYVYKEFQTQLGRGPEMFYKTNLIWK